MVSRAVLGARVKYLVYDGFWLFDIRGNGGPLAINLNIRSPSYWVILRTSSINRSPYIATGFSTDASGALIFCRSRVTGKVSNTSSSAGCSILANSPAVPSSQPLHGC